MGLKKGPPDDAFRGAHFTRFAKRTPTYKASQSVASHWPPNPS
jgi:hypothetical protein